MDKSEILLMWLWCAAILWGSWSDGRVGVSAKIGRMRIPTVSICVSILQGSIWGQLIAERGQLHVTKTCGQNINEDVLHIKEATKASESTEINGQHKTQETGGNILVQLHNWV